MDGWMDVRRDRASTIHATRHRGEPSCLDPQEPEGEIGLPAAPEEADELLREDGDAV